MGLTAQQADVLDNLNRVLPLVSRSPFHRYQLDGSESTTQVDSLIVRELVCKHSDGRLKRAIASGSDRTRCL